MATFPLMITSLRSLFQAASKAPNPIKPLAFHQGHPFSSRTPGKSIYVGPKDDVDPAIRTLGPGDTLVLRDGLYDGCLPLEGIHGSAEAPITIKAEHDGKAIIDGGGTTIPLQMIHSSFLIIEGLSARNSSQEVVCVYNSHHITVRRVTGAHAGSGNQHIFDIKFGSHHVLIEDCAGWGRGRYIFLAYHARHVTFRRTWARWTDQTHFSPAPRSAYGVYGSSQVTLENVIGYNTLPPRAETDYFTAVWQTSDGPATNQIHYYGCMFFNNWEGVWVNDLSQSKETVFTNCYFGNTRRQGSQTTNREHGDGVRWQVATAGLIQNSTFVQNETGLRTIAGSPTVHSSVFYQNDQAIAGDPTHSHIDVWQNGRNGIKEDTTDQHVDPGYDLAKYGQGAYLFIPPTSPLKRTGLGGTDIGANILYCYQDGVLTDRALWPWPMEERIKTETGYSVTWESGGGLWKTLSGIYDTPPPAPLSTAMDTY